MPTLGAADKRALKKLFTEALRSIVPGITQAKIAVEQKATGMDGRDRMLLADQMAGLDALSADRPMLTPVSSAAIQSDDLIARGLALFAESSGALQVDLDTLTEIRFDPSLKIDPDVLKALAAATAKVTGTHCTWGEEITFRNPAAVLLEKATAENLAEELKKHLPAPATAL